jgi:DHA3 family macrolide efflux protein-like MFS transporter
MNPITNGPLMARRQAVVRPDMQGRVFTVISSLAGAMSPLGMLIAGPVADALGARFWYLLGGAVCLFMGLIAPAVPAIIHIEDNHSQPDVSVATQLAGQAKRTSAKRTSQ